LQSLKSGHIGGYPRLVKELPLSFLIIIVYKADRRILPRSFMILVLFPLPPWNSVPSVVFLFFAFCPRTIP